MIKGMFKFASDLAEVIVDGNNLLFYDVSSQTITTIEGIRLSKSGVIKEHPDLKDDEDWRKKAIERLKEHMKKYETEQEKLNYVKLELEKFGWISLYKQRAGFRQEKF